MAKGTMYAVVCVNRKGQEQLCGLFVNEKKADEALDFWNQYAMPGYTYRKNYIVTDLKGV